MNFDASMIAHSAACGVKQQAELLVLDGYRGWISAISLEDESYLEKARAGYLASIGFESGRFAFTSLERLVKSLSLCARCPLRCFAPHSGHLCRDECLLLAMVSAIQHGNEDTLHLSIKTLCGPSKAAFIAASAGEYALIMKACNAVLLPVPLSDITSIISHRRQPPAQAAPALH